MEIMPQPTRILVIRLSAIGDIVFASPLIAALRRAYPQAHLAWLAQPECEPLLRHHPDLDQVILWPRGEWQALWRERRWRELGRRVRALRAELRRQRFDLALDLQGLLKSGLLAWLSGAQERVGLGSREGSQWLMTRVVPRGGDPRAIGSEYRFLAERLGLFGLPGLSGLPGPPGLPREGFPMALAPGAEDRSFTRDLIARQGWGSGYGVVCPFTSRPQKHWFEERSADLAARLHRDLGLPVLMLGGPADRGAAVGIAQRTATAGPGLTDLAGGTSLLQAAALIEASRLVIGVDTGLSHMGIAFGRPTLLLFGSTRPYLDTGRANARVLYHPLPCSPCKRRPTCGGAFDCMRRIEVDEVLGAASDLLRPERQEEGGGHES